jgi:hypothetical protein
VLRRLQDTAQLSRYDDYWLERGGRRGGPFGFVFGPLEATAPSGDRRDATKAAVVAGMEAFVAARRAPPRAPDRDLCAQTPDLLSPNLSDVLPYVRTTLPSLLRALLSQSGRLLRHLDSPKLPVAPGDFSAFRLLDRSTSAISDCLRTIASKAPSQLAVTNLDAPAASI